MTERTHIDTFPRAKARTRIKAKVRPQTHPQTPSQAQTRRRPHPAPPSAVSGAALGATHGGGGRSGMEFMRVARVARYLDVSKKRVYQLVQERRLEAIRLGPRQMRIVRASLEAYLSALAARARDEIT